MMAGRADYKLSMLDYFAEAVLAVDVEALEEFGGGIEVMAKGAG